MDKNELEFLVFKHIIYSTKKNVNNINELYLNGESNNFKQAIKYICHEYDSFEDILHSSEYEKLLLLYKKCRIKDFVDIETYINLTDELVKKFNLKTYKLLNDNYLFQDKKCLINMIGSFGLFEKDKNVQNRINKIINIFYYQDTFSKRKELEDEKNIFESKNVTMILDPILRYNIPDEIKAYLMEEISVDYFRFLKHFRGSIGKKITDFISPYKKEQDCFKIKDGALKYLKILYPNNYDKYININEHNYKYETYSEVITDGYTLSKQIELDSRKEYLSKFRGYELTYSPCDIQSIFSHMEPKYDETFYNFFVNHQVDITVTTNNYSKMSGIQKNIHEILSDYEKRGRVNPDFITMINWLREIPYNVEFGDELFSLEAKKAGVLADGYNYYINLLRKTEKRFMRSIPNHKMRHIYEDIYGNEYLVETEILEPTSFLNLLIGESKYTDCCQKYNDLGVQCLEHASTSPHGGILVVKLIEGDNEKILSHSWIWSNENELVLDNVEQTSILNAAPNSLREIYEDLIGNVLKEACLEIIKTNNEILKIYEEKQIHIINSINDLNEKTKKLKRLKEVLKRQRIKVITIGSNYSDIIVKDFFPKKAERKLELPKDYSKHGYSDASLRYIAYGSEENIDFDENYKEELLYRQERKINFVNKNELNNSIIKKAYKIYISKEEFISLEDFIDKINNYNYILYGDDWFYLSSGQDDKLIIGTPRIVDEYEEQLSEIKNIKKILELKVNL